MSATGTIEVERVGTRCWTVYAVNTTQRVRLGVVILSHTKTLQQRYIPERDGVRLSRRYSLHRAVLALVESRFVEVGVSNGQ